MAYNCQVTPGAFTMKDNKPSSVSKKDSQNKGPSKQALINRHNKKAMY